MIEHIEHEPALQLQAMPAIAQPRPAHGAMTASTTPAALLAMAVAQGADLDRLERLMALQERWEAGEAHKAFVQAMTDFKSQPLDIFKKKKVGYETDKGDFVGYSHAALSDIADVVVPAMARCGLSHRWDVKQADGRITVTCAVTHRQGHSEAVTMDASPDNSGKKNAIQQVASSITYMQRYTLLAITGLATKDDTSDDDARGAGGYQVDPLEMWAGRAALAQTLDELGRVSKDGAKDFKGAKDVEGFKAFSAAVIAAGARLRNGAPPPVQETADTWGDDTMGVSRG